MEVPITVVFLNQSYLIQPEIIAALRRLPQLRLVVLDITSHPDGAQAGRAAEILRAQRCRILFTVNEWGIDTGGIVQAFCESAGVLHVNWCVDDPFYEAVMLKRKFRPSSCRIDFVSDRDYLPRMRAQGYNARFLPLAVDPQMFRPSDGGYTNDCAFVGNSYLMQIDAFARGAESLLDSMVPFLAGIMRKYFSDAAVDVAAAVEEFIATSTLPQNLSGEKAAFIAKHFAGYLYRKHIVASLLSEIPGFFVYGDDGWLQVAARDRVRKVRYERALSEVYGATRVNVDINRVVIRNGFTQRVFDTLASGAFVITSAKPVIGEFFETAEGHREIETFENAEELHDKIRYYLNHEEKRKAVAERGRARVLGAHTYDHRIGTIFRLLREDFGKGKASD